MSTQRKTYISEALLSEKPKQKLGLLINDNAVTTPKIRDKAVTTEKIALEAITHKLLADNSINTNNLDDACVTGDKIMNNTIIGDKLQSGIIDKRHIASDSITEEKMAAGSVSTDEIQDGVVTYRKLALDVTRLITALQYNLARAEKAQQDIIDYAEKLAKDAKENPKVDAILNHQIVNGAIDSTKLAVGAVQREHIAADAITEEKIAAGAISTDEVQDGCITLQKLAPDVINKLMTAASKSSIINSIVFMQSFGSGQLPHADKAGAYAYNGQQLYKSVLNNVKDTIEWIAVQAENNKIYVDDSTAQSFVANKGKLVRLDKEVENLNFDVLGEG